MQRSKVVLHSAILGLVFTCPALAETPLPFTIAKDTTNIVSPLTPDGMVDYVAAVNQQDSIGVTHDNNAFIPMLAIVGTNQALGKKKLAPTLQSLGVSESDGSWIQDFKFFEQTENLSEKDAISEFAHLGEAGTRLWKPEEFPHIAAYLRANEEPLNKALTAATLEKWWCPLIVLQRPAFLADALPPFWPLYSIANAWRARAMLRAGQGDFAGALNDLVAARKFSRLAVGSSMYSRFVAARIDFYASETLANLAAPGNISADKIAQLRTILNQFPPLPEIDDSLDHYERWAILDIVENFALGHADDKVWTDRGHYLPAYDSLDPHAVDWNIVLRHINLLFDQELALLHQGNASDELATLHDFEARVHAWQTHGHLISEPYAQHPDETDAAYAARLNRPANRLFAPREANESANDYSVRIAETLCAVMWPNFADGVRAVEQCRMKVELARVLLAAAAYHADKHSWPTTLDDLVPLYLPKVPTDIFSPAAAPVNFLATDTGASVYSVGPNGIDDGGILDEKLHADDIVVGFAPAKP